MGEAMVTELIEDPVNFDAEDEDYVEPASRRTKRSSVILGSLVLVGAGFIAGMQYQKHYGASNASSSSAGPASGAGSRFGSFFGRGGAGGAGAGGAGGAGAGGAGGAGGGSAAAGASGALSRFGGAVAGTVANISGDTLYVTESNGTTVAVSTTGAAFSKTVSGTVNDVLPGDSVIIRGSQQTDGSYDATSVSIAAQGSGGGLAGAALAGGFGGGAPASSATSGTTVPSSGTSGTTATTAAGGSFGPFG